MTLYEIETYCIDTVFNELISATLYNKGGSVEETYSGSTALSEVGVRLNLNQSPPSIEIFLEDYALDGFTLSIETKSSLVNEPEWFSTTIVDFVIVAPYCTIQPIEIST